MALTIKIKKLHPDAIVPTFHFSGDAGLDLHTVEDVSLAPGERKKIGTGIAIELPEGYVCLVWDKSGLATKHGLTNLAGVIDSGYRGEYFITMLNTGSESYHFAKGDKIAQILIQKVEHPHIIEVEELSDTDRGSRGHGSGK